LMLAFGASVAFLVSSPWLTLSAIAAIYLISMPLSYRSYRRMGVENQHEMDKADEEDDDGESDEDPEEGLNRVHQN
ncbi:MAG TPA: CDP-diacylglycerol O-phosphatidyltransferase, partial [Thalassospira lucentensis]|nr:CDP-diacylglycerol O-phosphatidyltransferase [Thalassospira lucentensis]